MRIIDDHIKAAVCVCACVERHRESIYTYINLEIMEVKNSVIAIKRKVHKIISGINMTEEKN